MPLKSSNLMLLLEIVSRKNINTLTIREKFKGREIRYYIDPLTAYKNLSSQNLI